VEFRERCASFLGTSYGLRYFDSREGAKPRREKQMKNIEEISGKDGVKRIANKHTNFAPSRESTRQRRRVVF